MNWWAVFWGFWFAFSTVTILVQHRCIVEQRKLIRWQMWILDQVKIDDGSEG